MVWTQEIENRIGNYPVCVLKFYSNNCNYLHTGHTAVVRSGVH